MTKSDLILLVDDEASIVSLLRLYLEREGFVVASTGDGLTALELAEKLEPSLVVLDVMLPEMDGFEVCRRLRSAYRSIAIIMLTAREDDIDKILGLELGADDYMTKPFNPRELVARVKAILRRISMPSEGTKEIIRVGDLTLDVASREVRIGDQLVDLRTQEFEVLWVLVKNPGRVLSREQLLNLAWGYEFFGQTRTVDVHIAQIRRKLSTSTVKIETITGIGYKLVA
ncbi:MAG TPA: response regulator transcription factor [Anaerolineaceae bacterium]|nr:response regulator transcription factor [Anaerolineaceae bacterium]HQO96374.1 response regulator transcription factor [Anaerolineaceae bacterium]HQP59950.1 response regulator transcription factor [Anaerolineaceae bacterium]